MSNLLSQASLVMIPSGYKEDVVYSQIPTNGNGDLSFTRASNGTRINSAGLVEVVAWNLVQYSETFDTDWTTSNVTITANDTTAPNGTTTAEKALCASGSSISPNIFYSGSLPCTSGQVYTYSYYAKKGTTNFAKIRFSGTAFASVTNSPIFNLNTGVVVSGTGTIESVGNGWYRISATATAEANASGVVTVDIPSSTGVWPNGNFAGTEYIYIWGAQLNIGATAKPYFPTTDRLNVPRLTYQNGGGGCPSLLLEKQSTNYARKNNDLGDWSIVNSGSLTKNLNAATSPDGTTNAINLVPNTANNGKMIYDGSTSQSSGGNFTMTCYAKANGYSKFGIRESQSVGYYATFNLSNGTVIDNGGNTASIENVGNGWYRCIVSVIYSGNVCIGLLPLNDAYTSGQPLIHSYAGDGTKGVLVYGPQLEVSSSYATSLIPTTSSSATRVADACFKTGISSLIGQSQGTIFVDSVLTHSTTNNEYLIQVSASSSNRFFIYREALSNKLGCFALIGSTQIYTQLTSGAITGRVKAAFAYQSGSFAFYVNGTQIGVSTATFSTPPTMDRLDIDSNAGLENGYYNYNEAILFPTRLTNAELASLTTI